MDSLISSKGIIMDGASPVSNLLPPPFCSSIAGRSLFVRKDGRKTSIRKRAEVARCSIVRPHAASESIDEKQHSVGLIEKIRQMLQVMNVTKNNKERHEGAILELSSLLNSKTDREVLQIVLDSAVINHRRAHNVQKKCARLLGRYDSIKAQAWDS